MELPTNHRFQRNLSSFFIESFRSLSEFFIRFFWDFLFENLDLFLIEIQKSFSPWFVKNFHGNFRIFHLFSLFRSLKTVTNVIYDYCSLIFMPKNRFKHFLATLVRTHETLRILACVWIWIPKPGSTADDECSLSLVVGWFVEFLCVCFCSPPEEGFWTKGRK